MNMKTIKVPLFIIALGALSGCFDANIAMKINSGADSFTWYVDADGDGYGDENDEGTPSTTQPVGYVNNNRDCNDNFATGSAINPNATEDNTDPADLNCNGEIGEAPFMVGDYGPAGGIVFQTDGTNGLEAAPEDQVDNNGTAYAEWGCYEINLAGADSLSNGRQNTADLLAANCSADSAANPVAINLVRAYSLNGYQDWYLPAKDELNTLFEQKDIVGNFTYDYYWSSTEFDVYFTWQQLFGGSGQVSYDDKVSPARVRAVRAF